MAACSGAATAHGWAVAAHNRPGAACGGAVAALGRAEAAHWGATAAPYRAAAALEADSTAIQLRNGLVKPAKWRVPLGRARLLGGGRGVRSHLLQPLLLLLPLPVLLPSLRVSWPPPSPRVVHGFLDEQGEDLSTFSPCDMITASNLAGLSQWRSRSCNHCRGEKVGKNSHGLTVARRLIVVSC